MRPLLGLLIDVEPVMIFRKRGPNMIAEMIGHGKRRGIRLRNHRCPMAGHSVHCQREEIVR
jgi:hypothetical protein